MTVPAAITTPAVIDADAHYEDMRAQLSDAIAAQDKARKALPAAQERDRDAYADAIKNGKPDPGEKHKAKAQANLNDATRRVDALRKAEHDAKTTLTAAIHEAKTAIEKDLTAQLVDAEATCEKAIYAVEAAFAKRYAIRTAMNWIDADTQRVDRRAPGGHTITTQVSDLADRRPGSEVASTNATRVFAALRAVLDPPQQTYQGPGVAGSNAAFLGLHS